MKKDGISVSQLIGRIKKYANSGEINYTIQDKSGAMEAVRSHFCTKETPTALMDFDGYRIEFKDWWFSIRPSNTEPYLRLLMEARSKDILDEKMAEMNAVLKNYFFVSLQPNNE